MNWEKSISRIALSVSIICIILYFFLSYFLLYSLEETTTILRVISAVLFASIIIYLSPKPIFRFKQFENELTFFSIILGAFFLSSILYNERTLGAIASLKGRRLGFLAVDIFYLILAALLIYLFVIYFFSKFNLFQKITFYFIIFLFIVSIEMPIVAWLLYILCIIIFAKIPWLIAVSHKYRKILFAFLVVFWILFFIFHLPLLESFEPFPGAPRLLISTPTQLRLNSIILIITAVFTVSLFSSLIETSRTLRSKNVLIYVLTSFIPIAAILILFVLSYINISVFFKSYILEDKFIDKIRRYNAQFLRQPGFINIIKYAESNDSLKKRLALERYGELLRNELGEKPFFKLQYKKNSSIYEVISSEFPESLNPNDQLPQWYYTAETNQAESGIKELMNRIFSKKIHNADRMFIRAGNEVFFYAISSYEDKDTAIQLALFMPMSTTVANKLYNDFGIHSEERDESAYEDKDPLAASFCIRELSSGEPTGSLHFAFFKSLNQLIFGKLTGNDTLTRFVGGLRDLTFSVLLLFIFIIGILGFIALKINRGIRLALQTIILGMRRIGEGNLDYKIELKSRDEYYWLATSINEMTSDIKSFTEDRVEKEKLKAEVHTAYNIQRSILPEYDPDQYGLEIMSYIKPAEEVGGDFYDYVFQDDDRIGLVIGDVSGHGIPAGLLMAMAKSCIHNQAQHSTDVIDVMNAMNKMVFDTVQRRMFMTFLYAIIDRSSKKLVYSNAGHHFPYILKKNGNLISLEYPSYPLGVRKDGNYKKRSVEFKKGDTIIFYSDGIIEQTNKNMDLFGFTGFEDAIKSQAGSSAKEMLRNILSKLDDFAEDTPRVDDVTLIVIKINK
jgi:serine phosphatase RsbU (regulator of sigma subunit)